MFEHLPSLRGFQPRFYHAGASRFSLAPLYDLVAAIRPRHVVILGWDGDMHFTLCQAAQECALPTVVTSVREGSDGAVEIDDEWLAGVAYGDEFHHGVSRLIDPGTQDVFAQFEDESVEILIVRDFADLDSVRAQLEVWNRKLSPAAVTVVHGLAAERAGGPQELWSALRNRHAAEFPLGAGLGITSRADNFHSPLLAEIFRDDGARETLTQIYALIAERIDAVARAENAERENRYFQLRQTWQPTLLDDRVRMQATIDHLNRHIEHITRVHEWDAGQAQHRERVLEDRLARAKPEAPRRPKTTGQKISEELARIPRNLQKLFRGP